MQWYTWKRLATVADPLIQNVSKFSKSQAIFCVCKFLKISPWNVLVLKIKGHTIFHCWMLSTTGSRNILCVNIISWFRDYVLAAPKQILTLFIWKYPYFCYDETLGNLYSVHKFFPFLMVVLMMLMMTIMLMMMMMMMMMTLVRICDTFSRMAEAFLPIVPSSITPPTWSSLWWLWWQMW